MYASKREAMLAAYLMVTRDEGKEEPKRCHFAERNRVNPDTSPHLGGSYRDGGNTPPRKADAGITVWRVGPSAPVFAGTGPAGDQRRCKELSVSLRGLSAKGAPSFDIRG